MLSSILFAVVLAFGALLGPIAASRTAGAAQPAAAPAPNYSLLLSRSADRSGAVALQGQTVSGNIYVFTSPDSGVSQVRFYLDNTSESGAPVQTENIAPYDFAGSASTTANPYDTGKLSNGQHSITAAIDLTKGRTINLTSSFTVANSLPVVIAPTPTSAPTATLLPPTATPLPPTPTPTRTATSIAPSPTPAPTATATPAPTASAASNPIYWGVNMQGVPWDLTKLSTWETNVAGKAVSVINWGHFWGDSTGAYQNWSSGAPNNARSHGAIPMISWTPEGGPADKWQLGDIINGTHDAYIRQFATDAKAWAFPFFLRIMHEMNGTWGYNWQETQNGNQPGQFVTAWKHIVDIFRQVGVTNASLVWCPNIAYPNTVPTFAEVYPGDSYVDWTCLDGYNWGTTRSSGWQSFDTVYNWSYNEILKIAPAKPMMIGEFGSVEQGGSKADWFTDALTVQLPQRYPKMRAAVYYNWQFSGVDWRIETSTTAQDAWKRGITSAYYAANKFGAITGKVAVP